MRTCKDCAKFIECLRCGDVVVNIRGGEHICSDFNLRLPEKDGIVEVIRGNSNKWSTALFYYNGKRPVFAQFGSEINDVTQWRKKRQDNGDFIPYNDIFG